MALHNATESGTNYDLRYIEQAITKAKRRNPALSATTFDFLLRVLRLRYPEKFQETDKTEWIHFVMRFQQVTGAFGKRVWADTAILIPDEILPGGYRNIFTGDLIEETKQNGKRSLLLGDVLANFPVALLENQTRR